MVGKSICHFTLVFFQKFSDISVDLLLVFGKPFQIRCSNLGFKLDITDFDKKLGKSFGSSIYIANGCIEFVYSVIK